MFPLIVTALFLWLIYSLGKELYRYYVYFTVELLPNVVEIIGEAEEQQKMLYVVPLLAACILNGMWFLAMYYILFELFVPYRVFQKWCEFLYDKLVLLSICYIITLTISTSDFSLLSSPIVFNYLVSKAIKFALEKYFQNDSKSSWAWFLTDVIEYVSVFHTLEPYRFPDGKSYYSPTKRYLENQREGFQETLKFFFQIPESTGYIFYGFYPCLSPTILF